MVNDNVVHLFGSFCGEPRIVIRNTVYAGENGFAEFKKYVDELVRNVTLSHSILVYLNKIGRGEEYVRTVSFINEEIQFVYEVLNTYKHLLKHKKGSL